MISLQFKCTLLSDVILNQKAATEGAQASLDFIPGSNFLGIVASQLYNESSTKEDIWKIFHSGNVRFGDAHPGKEKIRALQVPASMFYPKLKKAHELCYLHHYYQRHEDHSDQGHPWQLKQCRNGFYIFANYQGNKVEVQKSFAIKSAYNRDLRRSQDQQMYGYQSIIKGSSFYFEVTLDDSCQNLSKQIVEALKGKKRIGRSRTAQYGLVYIEEQEFKNIQSQQKNLTINNKPCIMIYADSRLIFMDDYHMATFQPNPAQLNLPNGKILWDKSQIRTFQYAPWNFTRQSRDTDRCGIEKGSVFVVEVAPGTRIPTNEYVGCYQNEGFGKVIYNPKFLEMKSNTNGETAYTLNEPTISPVHVNFTVTNEYPLLKYLISKKQEEQELQTIYQKVNEFVKTYGDLFKGQSFSAQWGSIRNIAIQQTDINNLFEELFNKVHSDKNNNKIPNAYLTHGVAQEKWSEWGRLKIFKEFAESLDSAIVRLTIINLASEMAKNCRRKKS